MTENCVLLSTAPILRLVCAILSQTKTVEHQSYYCAPIDHPWSCVTPCRFRKKADGGIGIGNYVAAVSRLNLLWTAACGVIEIVGMIQRRQELLEVTRAYEP